MLVPDIALSYLPLSHVAEQMFTIHIPASIGAAVYFAESMAALADNLKEVRPTVFFGVPRVWEKLEGRDRREALRREGVAENHARSGEARRAPAQRAPRSR